MRCPFSLLRMSALFCDCACVRRVRVRVRVRVSVRVRVRVRVSVRVRVRVTDIYVAKPFKATKFYFFDKILFLA